MYPDQRQFDSDVREILERLDISDKGNFIDHHHLRSRKVDMGLQRKRIKTSFNGYQVRNLCLAISPSGNSSNDIRKQVNGS